MNALFRIALIGNERPVNFADLTPLSPLDPCQLHTKRDQILFGHEHAYLGTFARIGKNETGMHDAGDRRTHQLDRFRPDRDRFLDVGHKAPVPCADQ